MADWVWVSTSDQSLPEDTTNYEYADVGTDSQGDYILYTGPTPPPPPRQPVPPPPRPPMPDPPRCPPTRPIRRPLVPKSGGG